jgi:hypothetical protein
MNTRLLVLSALMLQGLLGPASAVETSTTVMKEQVTPIRRDKPTFRDAFVIQAADLRGRLNAFATAEDGSVWRFREPRDERHWLVEPLPGQAKAAEPPAIAMTDDGLFQVWITSPDHQTYVSHEKPADAGWTSWSRVRASPAQDVTILTERGSRILVVIRGLDGTIEVGRYDSVGGELERVRKITFPAASRPVVIGSEEPELVFSGRDGTLRSVILSDSAELEARPLDTPRVSGSLSSASVPGGGGILVARGTSGEVLAVERTRSVWLEALRPSTRVVASSGLLKVQGLGERNFLVMAQGPQNSLQVSRVFNGRMLDWIDTKIPVEVDSAPMMSARGRIVSVNGKMLGSLASSSAHFQFAGFSVFADAILPNPLVEDDEVRIDFTLSNNSFEIGTGNVTASWNGVALNAVDPTFAPPILPGQSFKGSFRMGQFDRLNPGTAHLSLRYTATTAKFVLDEPALGIGPVEISDVTQFASDNQDLHVLGFRDQWPTDDPPVQAGFWSCIPTTNEQQHACGSRTCSAENTPETCPQDCPTPGAAEVQSYNWLDMCRKTAGPPLNPTNVSQVKLAIDAAALAGHRIRALGWKGPKHTSNAQICTDGQVIVMEGLRGAAPTLGAQGDYCSRIDCDADLSTLDPVIETFEGVNTVRVGPGMRLFDLEEWLHDRGLSIGFAVPGFRDPTVGGALETGTHGSSPKHPSVISTRVRSLTMVMADGTVREFTAQSTFPDTLWKAVRANLGYLGVVVQVRLSVEPRFFLRATTKWITAADLLAPGAPLSHIAPCDWGEMVWFPSQGRDDAPVMAICATKTNDSGDGNNRLLFPAGSEDESKAFPAIDLMQRNACERQPSSQMESFRAKVLRYYQPAFTMECNNGLSKIIVDAPPELVPGYVKPLWGGLNYLAGGLLVPFAECCTLECNVDMVGKWHHMMSSELTPANRRPFERDWEVFIPGQNAPLAIQMAKSYFQQNGVSLPLIGVFLRFAPAEDGTLLAHTVDEGPFASDSTGMFFEMPVFLPKGMYCSDQKRYEKVYADLAEMLVSPPVNGRAHWGKNRRSLFQLQRRLGTYGDNITEFRRLVKLYDPAGMFANQFGVDMGLRWPKLTNPNLLDSETPGCTPDPPH